VNKNFTISSLNSKKSSSSIQLSSGSSLKALSKDSSVVSHQFRKYWSLYILKSFCKFVFSSSDILVHSKELIF
jgi:hypothetical protein